MASNQAKETDKTMKINKGKRMPKIAGAFEKEEEMATKNINKSEFFRINDFAKACSLMLTHTSDFMYIYNT